MNKRWYDLKVGDKVRYYFDEFDGSYEAIGTVSSIEDDHAVVSIPDIYLWVDEFSEDMFDFLEA